jgi:hypothetical protein
LIREFVSKKKNVDKNKENKVKTKYGRLLEQQIMFETQFINKRRNVMVRSIKISVVLMLILTVIMLVINFYFI